VAKYELTPEHRAQLEPWAQQWIANAMSTAPITEADWAAIRHHVKGLYHASNLTPPPDARIVFVPSPFVAAFAGGFVAALWAATRDATRDAIAAATWDATWAATRAATGAATRDAIAAATWDATGAATRAATRDATGAATWWTGVSNMSALAAIFHPADGGQALLQHASDFYRMLDGGNQWSAYPAFLSFFRHVAQLPLDYTKWDHYEQLARLSGPRVMHTHFCLVSARPIRLKVDDRNRPHAEDGPFCAWVDGSALWAWHGVYVPPQVILRPDTLTPAQIQAETNAEVRRVMIERMGWDVWLKASGAIPVHCDRYGDLYHTELDNVTIGVVVVTNSTPEPDGRANKRYALLVPPEHETAHAAIASTFGLTPATYAPVVET
jgi:hypothetical protein